MDDIEIEYLDEYKDLVMPGIKKSNDGRAATTASSEQTSSRNPHCRRSSSDSSGSSSINADIFQKLFDGKFIDDELLHESSSNANRNSRSRLSSSSSCSDDVINRLYGQQSNNLKAKRRDRLDSYDSIDDLGDALMGSNRNLQLPKATTSNLVQRKQHCDKFKSRVSAKFKKVEKKPLENKASRPNFFNTKNKPYRLQSGSRAQGSSSSSSGSSSFSQIANKKRPVTIVKPPKPDLKPPVHEPKQDPLHLQDFSDECDSDSSFIYDSEFYDEDETDEDNEEPKHVIDISTDTSTITSMADTVTPVVSDDEGQQNQHQLQTPHGKNERLQSYLNNLSSAESPPSKQKRIKRKSRSKEKKSLTPTTTATSTTQQKLHKAHEQDNKTAEKMLEEANDQLDEPSSSASKRRMFDEPDNQPGADYVDVNLTYETLERLSLNLEEQIINIDTERSIEFEKRSASKPRSNSSTSKQPDSLIDSSLSVSHVRKLTYSNESLDQLPPIEVQKTPVKSSNAVAKRGRPRKINPTKDNAVEQTQIQTIEPTRRKRGRPRKHFPKVIEKSGNIETIEKEKLVELKQSTPEISNQTMKDESNIPEINGTKKNITENEEVDMEKRILVESTIDNNQVKKEESNEIDQVKIDDASGKDPVGKEERTFVELTNKNEIESVGKALSQLENSNDSFVSAQEDISQRLQSSPNEPSELAGAKEDNCVEQLQVKAATEEESLKSEGAGKEPEEEMISCDSAVERDKEINVEKCDEESSVGQCIQTIGDKLELNIEAVLQDETLTESIPIYQPVENKRMDYNLMESSAQAADETTETKPVESLEENSCDSKADTPLEGATVSKEAELNIELPNNDEVVDNNEADEVKPVTDLNVECTDNADPQTEVKETKEDSSFVKSTNSPCPPTAAIETGRESRSSKRSLRSDVDVLVINEVQRRNSPRLTEKSPAGERDSPVQLKGNRKNKDKSSNDSHPKKTPEKESETKTDHEEAAIKEECSTESKLESSNPDGEENSTKDTQTPKKATETDDPENVETTLGKRNSCGRKSKLKNDNSSPRPVLVIPKDSQLPESNNNAQLLGDPTTSKDLINSTTENAPPSTDQREAKEFIFNQDDSSDRPDLISDLLTCKDPLTNSDSEPTITQTNCRSRTKNAQRKEMQQLTKTTDERNTFKTSVNKTEDLPKMEDDKSEKLEDILEMPKTMRIKKEKEQELTCTLSTLKIDGMSREVKGLLHDSKEGEHFEDDFRSIPSRTQTPIQKHFTKHTKNFAILRNSESLEQNGTQDIPKSNRFTISKTICRKCRVRIKRIKFPILSNNSDLMDNCDRSEKDLVAKEEKETGHTVLTELVKHSVEMKLKHEMVQLYDEELEVNVENNPEELKTSLDSQNEKETLEEMPQLYLNITKHKAQTCASSSLIETGVTTSVDNSYGDIADDFQRDEGIKHREMLKKPKKSRQNKMEPPAAPHNKRELPSVEGVLRKMAKKRKILESSKTDSTESAVEASVASRSPSIAQQNQLKTPMPKQFSPIKSALSCLLSDSEPATVDNSVIITKTSVATTTPTIETLKKKEITSTGASGINISVSVVPESNKQNLAEQETVPVKKTLTQAETFKRLLSTNAKSKVDSVASKAKVSTEQSSLAAGTIKKTKGRKPNVDKRTSLTAKLAIEPSELAEPTTIANSDNPVTPDQIKKGSEKVSVPDNSLKARQSVPQTQTENLSEITENVTKSKSNKRKSELPKTGKKALLNDSQISEEPTTTTTVAADTDQSVEGSTSESREPSNERTKRTNRAVKSTISNARATTPVTRATSQGRSATTAPTSDPVVSILDLPSKPQRQSRKNRKKSSSDLEHSMPSRKRKISGTPTTELTNVKRAKEDATNVDVAFPVRITAASTAVTVTAVQQLEPVAVALEPVLADQSKSNELSLPTQPLPLKLRKLRVRINRRTMRIWREEQQQQRQQVAAVTLPHTSELVPLLRSPRPPPVVAPVVPQRQVQRVLPAAKSVPLPVPLPVFEIKAEQEDIAMEQPVEAPATALPEPQTEQRVVDVRATIEPAVFSIAPPAVTSNPTSANAATGSSSSSSSGIPLASSTSDALTFGTTKMFSFLHPSRYQRSYGQVGLDFCCPNLDGPMQAIDPTRLHAKVEVPVLELPQYMVISTKFISKQDKNLPPKVRAKLDQLVAKEGLPCAIQAMHTTLPAPAAAPPATAVATIAPTAVPPPVNIVSKPVTSAPILPQKKQANLAESTGTSSKTKTVPGMLQLPTICPTDKLRTELQSRVQLFDAKLQWLARRAATMSASERQMVIENIVKTSSLLPNDVAVGTKLLESYVHHLNVATNMMESASPRASGTAKPISTTTQLSNSMLSKPGNAIATVSRQVQQQRVAGGATGGAVPAAAAAAHDRNSKSRPIYDKDKNIIGYQYKTPKMPSDTTTSQQQLNGASAKSSVPMVAQQQQLLHSRVPMKPATNQAIKMVPSNSVTRPAGAGGVSAATRIGSGTSIPFRNAASSKLATAAAAASSSSSSTSSSSNTRSTSNRNIFIVQQVLSQPEECILPDTVGSAVPTALDAEIKGEIEDTEMLS